MERSLPTFGIMSSPPTSSEQNEVEEIQLPLELLDLSTRLEQQPEALATGDEELQIAALKAAKHVFDMGEYLYQSV